MRAEQQRLVLGGKASSVATGVPVSTPSLAAPWPLAPHRALVGWSAASLAVRIPAALTSCRALRRPRDRRTERVLFVSEVVEGLIYGWLLAIGLQLEMPAVSFQPVPAAPNPCRASRRGANVCFRAVHHMLGVTSFGECRT